MKSIKSALGKPALLPLWGVLCAALYGYSLYSFRYEFLSWDNLPLVGLYAALSGLAFAGVWAIFARALKEKHAWIGFLAGLFGFEAILWTSLTVVNVGGQYNRKAVTVAYLILLPLFALGCFLAFWFSARRGAKRGNRATAILLCLVYAAASFLPVFPEKRDLLNMLNFETWPDFEPLSGDNADVWEWEQTRAETWFRDKILDWENAAYSLTLDGERFDPADWTFESKALPGAARGAERWEVTAAHKTDGLVLTVEAALYRAHATCEWTARLRNDGDRNSPVVSDFNAINVTLDVGKQPEIYCSKGSNSAADDFTMLRARRSGGKLTFSGTGGRPSDEYMPYFNFCGEDYGAVLGIGWTGQWEMQTEGAGYGVWVSARQQDLNAYLLPGEEIRSPLVSLSIYRGRNPVKGFNTFRDWLLDCVYPENTPHILNDLDVLFVSHTRTAEEIKTDVASYGAEILSNVDNFWMDAGWYDGCVESWGDGVGNWRTNDARFPGGLKEMSDLAAENGAGLVVWYEPERLVHGSYLYEIGQEHPEWIVDLDPDNENNTVIMWNLAENGARDFLAEYIGASLKDNGISIYRQDFNFEPLKYWEYADEHYYGGRAGICENHYVTNLYAYLDALFEKNPGLIMDNCASGGRRLDLEMTRRSIPLWRSDYNCEYHGDQLEATQAQTYGLSFWLPITGVNIYLQDEYAAISSIYGGNVFTVDSCHSPYYRYYDDVREAMTKHFYPSTCAGTKKNGVTVMQYGDADSGYVLLYQHEKAKLKDYRLRLAGLDPDATYQTALFRSDDAARRFTGRGSELRGEGIRWPIANDGPAAYVLCYEKLPE